MGVRQTHGKHTNSVTDSKPRPSPGLWSGNSRSLSSLNRSSSESGILVDDTNTGESVTFARGGLQNKVLRRLKRGEILFNAVLDLHGFQSHEAHQELEAFLSESILEKENCILIIHGKGYRSADGKGVLKPLTIDFLKQIQQVRGFTSALPKDGGTGAVYVLLSSR